MRRFLILIETVEDGGPDQIANAYQYAIGPISDDKVIAVQNVSDVEDFSNESVKHWPYFNPK